MEGNQEKRGVRFLGGAPSSTPAAGGGGVTWRAAAISLAVILVSAPAIFYGEVVWYKGAWSSGVPASWPLAVLFLLAGAGSVPLLRRWGLSRAELLTIYCVTLVATPLLSIYVLFWALSQPISYYYFAEIYPQWEGTFIRLIPWWFSPSSGAAVEGYFLGHAGVPWSEWLVPLAAWSSFLSAVFLANVCLLSLVQRQWVRHERLTFPLAHIPLGMVESAQGEKAGRLPRSRAFWIGAGIAFLLAFVSSLSQRLPALPAFPLQITIANMPQVGPLAALGRLDVALYPWVIGLAYLIPKEVSFSVWFLWVVRIGLCVIVIAAGAAPGEAQDWWRMEFPAPYNQATGAVLGLSAWALWGSRRHLGHAFRVAFGGMRDASESQEPLSYRWAFLGFAACFAWLVWFFRLAGCRPWFALAFPAFIVGAYLAYARLQAEAAFDSLFWWFCDVMLMPVGGKRFLPQEFISLYTANWVGAVAPSSMPSACSINALTSFKIADSAGLEMRPFTRLLLGGFFAALIVGIFVTLTGTYQLGFLGMKGGTGDNMVAGVIRQYGHDIYNDIEQNYDIEPSPGGTFYTGVGAVVCVLLGVLRLRLPWWPLHPVGYILSNSLPIEYGLFPFFIAWVAKVAVTRYGGLRLYRATLPLAVGVIVGDVLNRTTWNIVALVTKGQV
jgi:hypothetical protein